MSDEAESREVQGGDDDDAADGVTVIPAPAAGWTAAGGHLGAMAGGLMPPAGGIAPAAGAGQTVAGAQDEVGAFEDADSRLARRVEEALTYDGRLHSTDIGVAVSDGGVEIVGGVPTERERQLAEEICAALGGVRAVRNRLTVAE